MENKIFWEILWGLGSAVGLGELRLWAPLLGLFWPSIGLENVGDNICRY